MFDIGWTEMLVVAVIAIVFVGPRELPGMLRTFGRAIKKVRGLAGDFQRQFDDALKDAELDGVQNTIRDVRNLDPTKAIKDKLNPLKDDLEQAVSDAKPDIEFDPDELFDESKAPEPPKPVEVDVDKALEMQRKFDDAGSKAKAAANNVPGFSETPEPPRKPASAKTGSTASGAKKPVQSKASTRSGSKTTAASKATVKTARKTTGKTSGKTGGQAASKTSAKPKPATKSASTAKPATKASAKTGKPASGGKGRKSAQKAGA